jgi:hypothetical protein
MEKMRQEVPFKKGRDFEADVLQATVEYLGFKIECSFVQRVLMSWITENSLPRTTRQMKDIMRLYKDQTMMQVLQEKQNLNDVFTAVFKSQ